MYTLEDLSKECTYAKDGELEKAAKYVALIAYSRLGKGRVGISEFKQEVLAGKHGPEVMAFLEREGLKGGPLHHKLAIIGASILGIQPEHGLTIDVDLSRGLVTLGNDRWNADLEQVIKQVGGRRLDGKTLQAKLIHAEELPILLASWFRERKKLAAGAQRIKAEKAAQRQRSDG